MTNKYYPNDCNNNMLRGEAGEAEEFLSRPAPTMARASAMPNIINVWTII